MSSFFISALGFVLLLTPVPALCAKSSSRVSWAPKGREVLTRRIDAPGSGSNVQNFGDVIAASKGWLFVNAGVIEGRSVHHVVYVYKKSTNGWHRVQLLRRRYSNLGYKIILSHKQAFIRGWKAVGKGHHGSSVVFLYAYKRGRWRETGLISRAPGGAMAYNGKELFIANNVKNTIRIYAQRGGTWGQVSVLRGKKGFGSHISVSNNRLVVWSYGAGGFVKGHGKLSIYIYTHGLWEYTADIRPDGRLKDYILGDCAISTNGDTIFVVAGKRVPPVDLSPITKREWQLKVRRAYKMAILREEAVEQHQADQIQEHNQVLVYEKRKSGWKYVARAAPRNPAFSYSFGAHLWLYDNRLFVGAPRASKAGYGYWNGAVYVFQKKAGAWDQLGKLTGGDPKAAESFGTSLAMSGNILFIGAPSAQVKGLDRGAVYMFDKLKALR